MGIVAVQARSRPDLRTALLHGLQEGRSSADLIGRAAHSAEDAARQVAVLDTTGRFAVDTGAGSFPVTGHLIGGNHSVQGNMLASADVLPAMSAAYTEASGDLPDRLLAALTAGQARVGTFVAASRRRCSW